MYIVWLYVWLQIDGCYDYHILSSDLRLGESKFGSYGRLTIKANVTEDGTGKIQDDSCCDILTYFRT